MGRKRASQLDSNGQRITCRVCGSQAVGRRCGAVVCEACKKFFIRNRNSLPKLRCVNEAPNPNLSSPSASTEETTDQNFSVTCDITPNNRCCSRCRIVKCLHLGMRMKGKKTKPSLAPSAVSSCLTEASPSMSFTSEYLSPRSAMSTTPMSVQPPSSVSATSPDSTYVPKKLRAVQSNSKQPQTPFSDTMSEAFSPSGMSPISPPLDISQRIEERALPVFPSDSEAPSDSMQTNVTAADSTQNLRACAAPMFNFLAYQKFARDLQVHNANASSPPRSPTSSTLVPPSSLTTFAAAAGVAPLENLASPSAAATWSLLYSNRPSGEDDDADDPSSAPFPPVPQAPPNVETVANESMLRGIVRAFPSLQLSSKDLEMSLNPGAPRPSPAELWQHLMSNFENAVGMGLSYVKALPGVRQIDLKDRSEIFSDSFLPMAAAQQLIDAPSNRPDGFFLNMTESMRSLFLSYFPAYRALANEVHHIGQALSDWNPSFIEFVFLEAMLFYRDDVANLSNTLVIGRLRARLMQTLHAYLHQTCRSNDDAQGAMRQFYAVYNMLMRLPDVHNAVLSQTARSHPEIFGVSTLLGELYCRNDDLNMATSQSLPPPITGLVTSTPSALQQQRPEAAMQAPSALQQQRPEAAVQAPSALQQQQPEAAMQAPSVSAFPMPTQSPHLAKAAIPGGDLQVPQSFLQFAPMFSQASASGGFAMGQQSQQQPVSYYTQLPTSSGQPVGPTASGWPGQCANG